MAILHSDESNILDAETINWRLVVYPILAALVIVAGGFGYYYYQQNERDQAEDTARAALIDAKSPEDLVKVVDQYPHTDQATLALLAAADASFLKRDYPAAIADYQRILNTTDVNADLRNSAQLGLASTFEATGKPDDAIKAYMDAAQLGDKSPYAAYAYLSVARLYEARGDKENERNVLTQAAGLDADSPTVREAQYQLKQLTPPITVPVPANAATPSAAAVNIVPSPAPVAPQSPSTPAPVQSTTPAVVPVPTATSPATK
jgi:tetratricopeptide (TPR) repeat protein